MRKPRYILFKRFSARLSELNNYFPLFPISSTAKKMDPEELNDILLQNVSNSWAGQSYIQEWYFKGRSYKETCNMFERMKIAEAIYKGVAPSKNTQRVEADRTSSGRNKNGGSSASPSKPEQGRAGKRKIINAGHPIDEPTGAKNTFLLHGPGNS